MFTVEEKIKELKDEVGMRRIVYGNKVNNGTMNKELMDRKIGIFEAIIADYEKQRPKQMQLDL